jgi:deoxyribodipyrimidine photo-lyase
MKYGIVWFRNDLRVKNNKALDAALSSGLPLKAIYILDSRENRLGPFRKKFISESLSELQNNLAFLNINFDIISGNPFDVLDSYFNAHHDCDVFVHRGYATEEVLQEKCLQSIGDLKVVFFDDGFLISPMELPFAIHDLPDVFTDFRKKIESSGVLQSNVFNLHPSVDEFPTTKSHVDNRPVKNHPSLAFPFFGGESQAHLRLIDYIWNSKNILTYKKNRNGLLGTEYSSKLSPYLACGCISAQQIFNEIKKFEDQVEANESTYWLIFELLWRDYFRYVMMKYGSKMFLLNGIKQGTSIIEPSNAELLYESWIEGNTGDDFVDANMRELRQTGFMSNRGRQNVASFLVHELKLDWRRGARYFEKMLIDYDVFSNWGNWTYLAGVGNDPRENRVFNTERQAEMYDADGSYRKLWLNP